MSIQQTFTSLPKWAQGVVVVAGVGITAFVSFKIYQGVNKYIKLAKARQAGRATDKELKELEKQGKGQTLTDAQLKLLAGNLRVAMDGKGTDMKAIKDVFVQVKNDADVLALIKAYGIRTLDSGVFFIPDETGTLGEHLTSELGVNVGAENIFEGGVLGGISLKSEKEQLNAFLKKKGIKFQF